MMLGRCDEEESAQAVTFKDVVKLSRAGIGEGVLLKLIEMGNIACPITPSQLKALKSAGASDQVLLALLHNERSADDERPAAARRTRRLEDESLDQVPHEGARSVRAAGHLQRAGAVLVPARPVGADARAMNRLRVRGK